MGWSGGRSGLCTGGAGWRPGRWILRTPPGPIGWRRLVSGGSGEDPSGCRSASRRRSSQATPIPARLPTLTMARKEPVVWPPNQYVPKLTAPAEHDQPDRLRDRRPGLPDRDHPGPVERRHAVPVLHRLGLGVPVIRGRARRRRPDRGRRQTRGAVGADRERLRGVEDDPARGGTSPARLARAPGDPNSSRLRQTCGRADHSAPARCAARLSSDSATSQTAARAPAAIDVRDAVRQRERPADPLTNGRRWRRSGLERVHVGSFQAAPGDASALRAGPLRGRPGRHAASSSSCRPAVAPGRGAMRSRSASVVPPHTPYISPLSSAQARHRDRT